MTMMSHAALGVPVGCTTSIQSTMPFPCQVAGRRPGYIIALKDDIFLYDIVFCRLISCISVYQDRFSLRFEEGIPCVPVRP